MTVQLRKTYWQWVVVIASGVGCQLGLLELAQGQIPARAPQAHQAPARSYVRPAQYEVEGGSPAVPNPTTPATEPKSSRSVLAKPAENGNPPAANQPGARFVQLSFRLKGVAPPELEYQLLRLGLKTEVNPDLPTDRFTSFRWKNGNDTSVGVFVDRKNKTVEIEGTESAVRVWRNVIGLLDQSPADGALTQVVPLVKAEPQKIQQAMTLAKLVTQNTGKTRTVALAQVEGAEPPAADPPAAGAEMEEDGGLLGNVQIEFVDGLDAIVIRGKKKDVERVQRLIEEIERQSLDTQPELDIVPMKHVDNRSLSELIIQIYDQVYSARQGRTTIIPLIKPNAILLIGRKENLESVRELIGRLDQPVNPNTQLKVFPLKNISATNAEQTVRNFFTTRPGIGTDERLGMGTRVMVLSDFHANALIVQAAPRDLAEVTRLLKSLDIESNVSKQEVRIFKLKNALASDLAPVLQRALTGQGGTAAPGVGQQPQQPQAGGQNQAGRRSTSLQFLQIDGAQSKLLESGILSDMSVNADTRGNSLVVTGPSRGMELMEALIRQLDQLPAADAQIKVFTIVNGDATALATLLQQLFGQATAQGGFGAGGVGAPPAGLNSLTGAGESTLVPLRFSVDQRTNSIVVSGSEGDLRVVHQILIRLDEGDVRERVSTVYRLQNAPAFEVAQALNQWLQGRRQINQLETQITSPFEQIEREVIIVAEVISNSLIVSATPRYFEEVKKIVTDLDRRPPMVVIQVLIAEVTLSNINEMGVELGLQDSLLFSRGIGTVGFPFIGQPLGNNATAESLATRENLAGQATGHFSVGRTNSTLGYGGLVLSASNESVNMLIRALQHSRRLQIISRPQVQTLDNQPAFVQVGARVPRITSTQVVNNSTINATELVPVGILMRVTPRTSPDGLIVMEIDAEKSELGSEAEGIPISINANGDVIRSPQIKITTAQTTVSARSGQTIILGGLITQTKDEVSRRVPYLGDIPVLGRLFRYDSVQNERKELLMIMTPFVTRGDSDVEWMNQRESERLSWCLSDVANIHGATTLSATTGGWNSPSSPLIFPDAQPTSGEPLPAVAPQPQLQPLSPNPGHSSPYVPQPNPPPAFELPPGTPTSTPAPRSMSNVPLRSPLTRATIHAHPSTTSGPQINAPLNATPAEHHGSLTPTTVIPATPLTDAAINAAAYWQQNPVSQLPSQQGQFQPQAPVQQPPAAAPTKTEPAKPKSNWIPMFPSFTTKKK